MQTARSATPITLLPCGVVHLWIADARVSPFVLRTLKASLDFRELAKADNFRFERHRSRYIAAQGILRQILAEYIPEEPNTLSFDIDAYGKPSLASAVNDADIRFNMSHSEYLVVVALSAGGAIGVDVEFVRNLDDLDSIAREYFTPTERTFLAEGLSSETENRFYTCWTRKEAYIKAVGKGLSIPLTSFDTAMQLHTAGRSLPSPEDATDVAEWWLSDLTMPAGFAGALVVERHKREIEYLTWRAQRNG
jgi:4'-phosphopantetheinyl transferase